jgi:tetraacyldisaccharide 4'-kinase
MPLLAPVPTVVVGNWVVGGAGKTPTTLALLAHLQDRGWKPGVVSRGYARSGQTVQRVDPLVHSAQEVGDEPLLMARRSGVPVVVGHDRRRAREWLLHTAPEVDIVLADDGLQHHRLCRDLEVVVVDERGAGNGWCLPAGPLREPLPQRLSERTLVLYSGGSAVLKLPGYRAQRQLAGVQRLQDWLQTRPRAPDGGWSELRGLAVHAAAGIGVPERFFNALRQQGLSLVHTHALPDHDTWDDAPWPADVGDVIVTEKDAVKLTAAHVADSTTRVWVARLDLVLPTEFVAELDRRLQSLRPPRSATA